MKTLAKTLFVSLVTGAVGLITTVSAGNPSPRQIEENPTLVRPAMPARHSACNLCAVPWNAAYRRSPRALEENPELARVFTCGPEIPVKARGLFTAGTATWPRTLETR